MSTELFSTLPYKVKYVGALVIYIQRRIMLLPPLPLQVCLCSHGKVKHLPITGGALCRH